MKKTDKFSITRCAQIIIQDFAFNRSRYTLFSIACIVGMQIPMIMMLYYNYQHNGGTDFPDHFYIQYYQMSYNGVGSLIYFGLYTIAASYFASSLINKKRNYTHLMQPSTVLEKIAANFVVKGLCVYLILELSIALEIATFQMIKETFPADALTFITGLREIAGESVNIRMMITDSILPALGTVALLSAYFLGSTVWKNGVFIKTSIAIAAVLIITEQTGIYPLDDDIAIIATTTFTIVAWLCIYHIIKRKQIV